MKYMLRGMLLAFCALVMLQPAFSQVGITVGFGPPALPVYDLPVCPGDGYMWTPGYWGYDDPDGYYWVPGTWVLAPEPGYLWTPGWWGWGGSGFLFHEGYWATEVGFYGGIDYGFGYFGVGFGGGRWDSGVFRYNTAVLNVNTTIIHNTYVDRTVIVNNTTVNRVSYNGGQGGITARPTPREEAVANQHHIPPVAAQTEHVQAARANPQMRATANQGRPPIAATSRPGEMSGSGVVAAREAGAPYRAPARGAESGATNGGARPENPVHAADLPAHQVTAAHTGDPKLDEKYQKQQQKLVDKQNAEHQKLAQKQQAEDRKAAQRQNQTQQKHVEQQHQQQTQQMEQRHTQQTQDLQMRQMPRPAGRPR